jgi:hypothetical protein
LLTIHVSISHVEISTLKGGCAAVVVLYADRAAGMKLGRRPIAAGALALPLPLLSSWISIVSATTFVPPRPAGIVDPHRIAAESNRREPATPGQQDIWGTPVARFANVTRDISRMQCYKGYGW